jgi:uroporphyrinogen III methyltransferase/synthase
MRARQTRQTQRTPAAGRPRPEVRRPINPPSRNRPAHAARPLAGRRIVVTRAAAQAPMFVRLLEAAGAEIIEAPTIAIEPPASWEPLDRALAQTGRFRWVVFTSVNGVAMVDARLAHLGKAWSALARTHVAAIGPATAAALADHGIRAEVVPDEYRAEGLVDGLRTMIRPSDRVLLPRAAETRDILVKELTALGAEVREVPAYRTRGVSASAETLRRALAARRVDVVTFTSSSTARNFALLFTDAERSRLLDGVTIASIGPITAATARSFGLATTIVPPRYTIPALADAIAEYFRNRAPAKAPRRARARSR